MFRKLFFVYLIMLAIILNLGGCIAENQADGKDDTGNYNDNSSTPIETTGGDKNNIVSRKFTLDGMALSEYKIELTVGMKSKLSYEITYENNSIEVEDIKCISEDKSILNVENNNILVVLKEGQTNLKVSTNSQEYEIQIKVKAAILEKITIKKYPDKLEYFVGEKINIAGMEIMTHYSNFKTKNIQNFCKIIAPEMNTKGKKIVKVSYSEKGIEKMVEYEIKVFEKINKNELIFVEGGEIPVKEDVENKIYIEDIYVGKYEVTQEEFVEIMGYNTSFYKKGDCSKKRPVENISWFDAIVYCNKLSEKEGLETYYNVEIKRKESNNLNISYADVKIKGGKGYRLPKKIEWEYIAKGGKLSKNYNYSGSNNCEDVGVWDISEESITWAVGQKKENELGVFDMSGNVWEYCYDNLIEESNMYVLLKGGGIGGIYVGVDISQDVWFMPNKALPNIGFRIIKTK